jgi:glycosyltransferase involved in cell wall biosynthesis
VRATYLNPIGGIGGAERVLLHCLAGVRRALPEADLHLIVGAEGPLIDRARGLGVGVTLLPMPAAMSAVGDSALQRGGRYREVWRLCGLALAAAPSAWGYVRSLRRLLGRLQPTLIHSNGIKTHLLARLARPAATPVVWHLHDFYGMRPLTARALSWARGGVAGGIAISEAVARDARAALPGLVVAVVPNAVDLGPFSPGVADGRWLDGAAGFSPATSGTVRVGMVATYARWKGHEVFLEAAARAIADSPALPVRFYIVGGPIYHTRAQFSEGVLRARAAALGIADRVGFVGFQEDAARAYRALDVVVHASIQPEPFGLTIAEAMACGRPVIVSRAGGAAELFTHGLDGFGVPPGDVTELATAVRRLAADPMLRLRLGEAARKTALDRFDSERFGPQLLEAYRHLLRKVPADGLRPA